MSAWDLAGPGPEDDLYQIVTPLSDPREARQKVLCLLDDENKSRVFPSYDPDLKSIEDTEGLSWWKNEFGNVECVDIDKFATVMRQRFQAFPSQVVFDVVEHVICGELFMSTIQQVTSRQFAWFLYKFGPFSQCMFHAFRNLFDPHGQLQPWFLPWISTETCKKLVLDASNPSCFPFFVRASTTQKSGFVLVRASHNKEFTQHNVSKSDSNAWKYDMQTISRTFGTLTDFVMTMQHGLTLNACVCNVAYSVDVPMR